MAASTTRDHLDAALDGVSFPADRDALVDAAQRRDDDRTARALRAMPPVEYRSPAEVVASVALVEDDHPDEIPPEAR